jgi:hypothetical protein
MRNSKVIITLLFMATLASTAYLCFAYQAGCAGDLKGGALGDPHQALRYESLATGPMFIALLCWSALPCFSLRGGMGLRSIVSIAVFLAALVMLIFGGMQFETMGVQQCF